MAEMSTPPAPMYASQAAEVTPQLGQTVTAEVPPFRAWLLGTLLLTLVAAGAFVWLNERLDLLGLNGRNDVRIHTLPRYSAYLMARRYIPDHFDGLLIGNSGGTGYDTSRIHSYRVFNGAMRGASMREERVLTEEVLKGGHLKMVIILLSPSLTSQRAAPTTYMTPHDYTASFGSMQTLMIDFQALRELTGRPGPLVYDRNGRTLWRLTRAESFEPFPADRFALDPAITKDLYELVAELHAKHVKVYLTFAPYYEPKWAMYHEQLATWEKQVLAGFGPEDVVVRLPDSVLTPLQAERENFPDYVHMTAAANATVVDALAKQIDGR